MSHLGWWAPVGSEFGLNSTHLDGIPLEVAFKARQGVGGVPQIMVLLVLLDTLLLSLITGDYPHNVYNPHKSFEVHRTSRTTRTSPANKGVPDTPTPDQ